jgi:hypothetical protein
MTLTTSHRVVLPLTRVQPVIGRAFSVRADAKQRSEGVERVEPAVEAERELVEIGLQVLWLDPPVVRALQPCLQVRKDKVRDRQVFFRHIRVTALDHWQMSIAAHAQRVIGWPRIRDDHRAGLDRLLHKVAQRLSAAISDNFQAQPAGITSATSGRLVALLGWPLTNLNRSGHKCLIVNAVAFAESRPTNPCLINFNVVATTDVAADPVATLPNHTCPQLVKDIERRLIPGEAKLALELHGRYTGREARHQISAPKPCRQGSMGILHHGSTHQASLSAAFSALQRCRTRCNAEGLAFFAAMLTNETTMPADPFKVGRTRRVIWEKRLKPPQRGREREVVALVNVMDIGGAVHAENTSTRGCLRQPDKHAPIYVRRR